MLWTEVLGGRKMRGKLAVKAKADDSTVSTWPRLVMVASKGAFRKQL